MSDSPVRVPDALARVTDPGTSHEAVGAQPLNRLRRIVLQIFAEIAGDRGMTDTELDSFYEKNWGMQGWPVVRFETPRKRRSDLVGMGLIQASGAVEKNPYNRNEVVWEITAKGRDALEQVQS